MTIKDQEPSEIQVFSAEEQQQLSAKIEKMAGHIQLVMPDSVDDAWQLVVRMEEQALVDTAKRGLLYMSIKMHLGHGEFETKLNEYSIAPRSARSCIAVAKMFLALPESKRLTSAVLNMNKSKLIEMARLPVETVESLDDDDLDTLNDLSVREFRKEIRKLKDKHTDLEEQTATLINALETERLTKAPTTPRPHGSGSRASCGPSRSASQSTAVALGAGSPLNSPPESTPAHWCWSRRSPRS